MPVFLLLFNIFTEYYRVIYHWNFIWFPISHLKSQSRCLFSFVKIIPKKNGNYVLALRKRLFCIAKQPLLPCKTYAFGMQNNRFCKALIVRRLYDSCACEKYLQLLYCLLAMNWWIARSGGGVVYSVAYG